jgi:hypothetical protein
MLSPSTRAPRVRGRSGRTALLVAGGNADYYVSVIDGMVPFARSPLLLSALLLLLLSRSPSAGTSHRGQHLRELYRDPHRLQEMLDQPPYLSIVLVMRNDDYGGNLLHRFERAISDLAEVGLREGLQYELIVIEWNPPAGRRRLRDAVRWPQALLDVRIVTVPEAVHAEAACRGWEYEAKNLGASLSHGKVNDCPRARCHLLLK